MAGEKILIIDDEPDIGWAFTTVLSCEGYRIITAKTAREGMSRIKREIPNMVFLDMKLPDQNGLDLLKEVKKNFKDLLVIMLTGYQTVETAVEAMKSGAYDYVSKPLPNERLRIIVKNGLHIQSLTQEAATLRSGLPKGYSLNGIVAGSPQMQKVFDLIRRVAIHDVTGLILGESGTGKELVARAIHNMSQRRDKPFIPLDCTALPETLVESELFGYEKGAFTGAAERKQGRFEQAEGGTLFLDEIANMSPQIQTKLLRVIQEREFMRLGGRQPIKIDVRLIVATNADLNKAIQLGQFREDLYHRISTVTTHLPPLRERQGDIPLLCHSFLEKFSREMNKKAPKISSKAQQFLNSYHWPGNIRELENTIKSAILLADNMVLPEHLPFLAYSVPDMVEIPSQMDGSLIEISRRSAQTTEKELILRILSEVRWNKRKAASMLKIDYKTLYNKMKRLGIQ